MSKINIEQVERHLKTHPKHSAEDKAAVTTLQNFLLSDGKINTNFFADDKWPNTDGTFEFVSNPEFSRRPLQSFCVQIKGTHYYNDEPNGNIKYSLKSLAFPAYIVKNVSADPGILFVVLNPDERGNKRVFWKYMSVQLISSINFSQDSVTLTFSPEEEILDTNDSVNCFCEKLLEIIDHHSFVKRLETREYSENDIKDIIFSCNEQIVEDIERIEDLNDTRDNVSKRILNRLNDLCVSTLLLFSVNNGNNQPNLSLAWEQSFLDIKTKYLGEFYVMLKYRGYRIPSEGQAERLMLKYYNFMWQIRKDLNDKFGIQILNNLEKFPLKIDDKVDKDYYKSVAVAVDSIKAIPKGVKGLRYYLQKKTPFFVGKERYYEITLQLAGVYATKYNRITAYTKHNISTNYSIQIRYEEAPISLWGTTTNIKVITDWKVSIFPSCLNSLAKILYLKTNINSTYGEYNALMEFLTQTGVNFVKLIDLKEVQFSNVINKIFSNSNTSSFKEVLLLLRQKYSDKSNIFGHNVIRYLLIHLREETIECVLPTKFDKKFLCEDLFITSRCYPFEKKPLISNLAGSKTSNLTVAKDVISAVGFDKIEDVRPYLCIKNSINETGEIYFDKELIVGDSENNKAIEDYNHTLDQWERNNGFLIKEEDGIVYIDSFERDTIEILQKLLVHSRTGNSGQKALNTRFLNLQKQIYGENFKNFGDEIKINALTNVFVESKLILIYGAAGTGKTTLINYISNLMGNRKKLFLTKTHTALKNLERRIDNPGPNSEFVSIDSFSKKVSLSDYNIIFVDECSTIDNRTMVKFLNRIETNTLLVMAGDIHQIEAIEFGNWFYYAKEIIKTAGSNVELLSTWRTKEENLIQLWDAVRNKQKLITEKLAYDGPFSEDIGPNIFKKEDDDEVVLCLNYDGKFGLNNINNYFQNVNFNGEIVTWQEWTYKVGDPILFNDTKRFPVLYNNLKGKIFDIVKSDNKIEFTIDVDTILTENDCQDEELDFLGVNGNTTRIKFAVYEDDGGGTEQERKLSRMRAVVPFQLAYAVSIHKSQGLEYNSVKIIIPSSNAEKITHGIFYTAITRAKKNLKIFWSPETMRDIIKGFDTEVPKNNSLEIIKQKLY